jgi:hypothetical protein
LFTLGTVLLGFTSHARHEVGGHSRDSSPSGEMSFASITSMAISSMKRFKATYNHTMGLARKITEVGAE